MKTNTYTQGLKQVTVDEETGEIITQTVVTEVKQGHRVLQLPIKERFNNGSFITVFQEPLIKIAKSKNFFSKDEAFVLMYLIATAKIGNSIDLDYLFLEEELGIRRPNLVTAVKALERKNIIIRKKSGQRAKKESQEYSITLNFDQLNYNLAYNGKIKDFKNVKTEHPSLNENNTTIFKLNQDCSIL